MSKRKDGGKITLGMLKGKPVTTSVPSIAIKFHANAEQIEELYGSDEENTNNERTSTSSVSTPTNTSNLGEADSSPLKYFPRLVKRSTSIDVSSQPALDASPPSDPWKFFADIKGKITKSVEEKITEIKTRNQEEGSPHKSKLIKDSKENSSLSDSEDLSESSISKTCGIVSTTEGVEMSSDDDTPSLDKDKEKKPKVFSNTLTASGSGGLRQRFRLLKNKAPPKEGTVNVNNLSKLYNINTEKVEQALPEDSGDVEDAVDALEDSNIKSVTEKINNDDILRCVSQKFDNIELDAENTVTIREISGKDVRNLQRDINTVFAPVGFVDFRQTALPEKNYLPWLYFTMFIVFYYVLQRLSPYLAGVVVGMTVAAICAKVYLKFYVVNAPNVTTPFEITTVLSKPILKIAAIKEYEPLAKYEGWVNEYPEVYNPHTYHISKTQSVYLRLQGNLLRISHSKSKVPKRAMWNEIDCKPSFTHHRIYNLLAAKVTLLPDGLAKKRHWSKKYPICVTLSKDQMNFDPEILSKFESEDDKDKDKDDKEKALGNKSKTSTTKEKKSFRFRRKESPLLSQRFSKLTEDEEEFDLESDSRASTPSPDTSDVPVDEPSATAPEELPQDANDDELNSLADDWSTFSQDESPSELKLYIFGRTDREKEDWFRRFSNATHEDNNAVVETSDVESISELLSDRKLTENEYMKYMLAYIKPRKKLSKAGEEDEQDEPKASLETVLWLNAFIGRVLFDCMRDPNFTLRVRERIQRKLGAIKLPYFIEEILITELSLGKTPPLVQKFGKPVLDQRGLWVDFDLTYEGLVVLTLQTKVNLMKLKNPQAHEKTAGEVRSAMFHSDVDDSAESSSDEEGPQDIVNASSLDTSLNSTSGTTPSGSSNSSKKFIKMVDRIAESKFFQAATENKYIKKAMEGVSNTDLGLKVEMRGLLGTMVLNIPPPPSDRVWVGFRPTPQLMLSAHPIVGERNISFLMVTSWIEKKLVQEFQKIMVIPNMEDFIIPVMNPKLPE